MKNRKNRPGLIDVLHWINDVPFPVAAKHYVSFSVPVPKELSLKKVGIRSAPTILATVFPATATRGSKRFSTQAKTLRITR